MVRFTFFGKSGPKTKNCQFELKLGTYTNSNMHNSMVLFTFSISDQNFHFGGTFGPKN